MTSPLSRCPRKSLVSAILLLVMVGMILSACGESKTDEPTTSTLSTAAHDDPAAPGPVTVAFQTADGITLSGRLYGTPREPAYGSGAQAIILAHMYPSDQTSWDGQARRLAGLGYLVLTFDFRGYGASGGDKEIAKIDSDVTAAFDFLRDQGAWDFVFVGASMGGTACLKSCATLKMQFMTMSSLTPRLLGVVTLSAPVEFMGLSARDAVAELATPPEWPTPMLFIAAERDAGAAGARVLEDLSGGYAGLQILPGSDHGTDLFNGSQAAEVQQLLDGFLAEHMPLAD